MISSSFDNSLDAKAEAALVEDAQGGSADAFAQLVDRYHPGLFHFVKQRVNAREDAEDITQEAFLRAWRHIDRFSNKWRFSTWLYTIASRLVVNEYRRKRSVPFSALASTPTEVASETQPESVLMTRERQENLWALAEEILTEEQRVALWLRYIERFSVNEVASILGRTSVTTGVLLFRARRRLSEHIDAAADGESGLDSGIGLGLIDVPRSSSMTDKHGGTIGKGATP